MDKTYAETQGVAPFDWNAFLRRVISGGITDQEWEDAKIRSEMWTTCACGNQCAIIPREVHSGFGRINGVPVDIQLRGLGTDFHCAVDDKEFLVAKNILRKIEARSAILIAEELAKLNTK